tara:strand:- start:2235 stop:2501 length:267 start_codon:yes stop_codon:yes gene_type:complete
MKVQINKFGEGLEKTFNVNGNKFAIAQSGEDYNGTLTLWSKGTEEIKSHNNLTTKWRELHFWCYEDGNENYYSRKEVLDKLIEKAKNY